MTLLVSAVVLAQALSATAPECVYISEVAYDVVNEDTQEWVELVNLSDEVVSLDELRLGDEETLGGTEAIMAFPAGAVIGPWSFVVVATNAAGFLEKTGKRPDFELKATDDTVAKMSLDRTLGGARFELANGTDEVLLLDATGLLIDGVSWGRTTPLVGVVDTAVTPQGSSLTRVLAVDGPNGWRTTAPTPGVVTISGISGDTPVQTGEGEGEGEGEPTGEGEGEPVGEGEGEGEPVGEGEGEVDPVGEGEGEGEPVGEGEGEVDPIGEGEGEPVDEGGDGEGEGEPVEPNTNVPEVGVELGERRPAVGPPESNGCAGSPGAVSALVLVLWRRRRRTHGG